MAGIVRSAVLQTGKGMPGWGGSRIVPLSMISGNMIRPRINGQGRPGFRQEGDTGHQRTQSKGKSMSALGMITITIASRRYAIGYSVDNTGYFGTGYCEDGLLTDFWAFSDVITGINEIGNNIACRIFPNPCTDRIQLELAEGFHPQKTVISIYDMQGRELLKKTVMRDHSDINTHELEKGFYIVKISVDNDILVDRFKKE